MDKIIYWDSYQNFNKSEFDCQETGENEMCPRFMSRLQVLRDYYGKPMTITSGYRSPQHSIERRKSKPGTHAQGIAADIAATGEDKYILVQLAMQLGFTGIGVDSNFVHVDTRQTKRAIWGY